MPISEYQQSILNLRDVPFKRTRAIEERIETASRILFAQIQQLLDESTGNQNQLLRSVYLGKQQSLLELLQDYGRDIKRDMNAEIQSISDEIADIRETATNDLLRENELAQLAVDFSAVPRQTAELLAQRLDVEGLKLSSNDWAQRQFNLIHQEIVTGGLATDMRMLALRIREFVRGSEEFTKEELADLRTIKGRVRRRLGQSINAKAKRLARTEIANAAWESGRLSAEQSPIVRGIQWNLSARHPVWDVCDILASQDLYGLGAGVYPANGNKIPTRPHPNDLCYQTDALRPVSEWDEPKPEPKLQAEIPETISGAQGTDRHIEVQRQLAVDLVEATAWETSQFRYVSIT